MHAELKRKKIIQLTPVPEGRSVTSDAPLNLPPNHCMHDPGDELQVSLQILLLFSSRFNSEVRGAEMGSWGDFWVNDGLGRRFELKAHPWWLELRCRGRSRMKRARLKKENAEKCLSPLIYILGPKCNRLKVQGSNCKAGNRCETVREITSGAG